MATLTCPHCGERDLGEFHYGGDAGKVRPGRECDDEAWARYRFFRRNPKGLASELWCHVAGCGQWLEIERDTATHEIHRAKEPGS